MADVMIKPKYGILQTVLFNILFSKITLTSEAGTDLKICPLSAP